MRRLLMIGLILGLAGCSSGPSSVSSFNPFSWGRNGADDLSPRGGYEAAERDYRDIIDQVTRVSIERTSTGVVVKAVGVARSQGWHYAELVRINEDNATEATFEFRVAQPYTPAAVGPDRSREITAAAFLSHGDAAGLRTFTVIASRNSLSARR